MNPNEWKLIVNVRNRRVVFGRPLKPVNGRLTVLDACCCLYYPSGGDVGLAVSVPDGTRIGPVVPAIEMDYDSSEIVSTTVKAVKQWKALQNASSTLDE